MRLEYVFDYPSPYAYLASTRLKTLGIDAEHTPIDILTVMKAVNNQPTPACPPKARYTAMDAARWAALYGVPLEINWALRAAARDGSFEWHVLTRGALVARDLGLMEAYSTAVFGAIWAEPADLTSEQGRRAVLRKAGIDIPFGNGRRQRRLGRSWTPTTGRPSSAACPGCRPSWSMGSCSSGTTGSTWP
jgi:2-hydroxychromene-2-carboxylate isomerase